MPILVTGALGNVGSAIVADLQQAGERVRAGARNAEEVRKRFGADIEGVPFDFTNPATFGPALAGVERLFLMRPPAIAQVKRDIFPFIDAARQAGVKQIVFLSLLGVAKNPIIPHHAIEQYILASGLDYTFLRASFFMQNFSTTHRLEIKHDNELFVPAGNGKTSFVDVRDIASVGALALSQAGHTNQAYDLTGDEALDYYQVAGLFTEILDRPITYCKPSLLRFMSRHYGCGEPLSYVLVLAGIYTTARLGLAGKLSDDTERLLGRRPISFKQFVHDYRDMW